MGNKVGPDKISQLIDLILFIFNVGPAHYHSSEPLLTPLQTSSYLSVSGRLLSSFIIFLIYKFSSKICVLLCSPPLSADDTSLVN